MKVGEGSLRQGMLGGDHKEGVNNDVEIERGERVARVVVVPEADLHWHDDGSVEQQSRTAKEHSCTRTKDQRAGIESFRIRTHTVLVVNELKQSLVYCLAGC